MLARLSLRARVGYRQYVVRAVAVVALGGLQIAQLGDLAVVGLEVTRGDGLVAARRTDP